MRYFGITFVLMFIVLCFAGCNEQDNGYAVIEEGSGYTRQYTWDNSTDSVSERRLKEIAESKTPGGKREDGLHRIDYTNPSYIDVVVFTKRAQDYLRRNGVQRALEDFMNPSSQFVAGRMYVFAYRVTGECLAEWAEPEQVGRIVATGFLEAVQEAAERGGGWVKNTARDPLTGEPVEKESYVVYAGNEVIIGAGLYRQGL